MGAVHRHDTGSNPEKFVCHLINKRDVRMHEYEGNGTKAHGGQFVRVQETRDLRVGATYIPIGSSERVMGPYFSPISRNAGSHRPVSPACHTRTPSAGRGFGGVAQSQSQAITFLVGAFACALTRPILSQQSCETCIGTFKRAPCTPLARINHPHQSDSFLPIPSPPSGLRSDQCIAGVQTISTPLSAGGTTVIWVREGR